MKSNKKSKYYPFLDVVIDVFYSIVLYNAFTQFPGFKIESLLMLLSVFIMLNYWWTSRSYRELPKYYLFDFYFIAIIMFVFTQWSNYYLNITLFVRVLAIFFAVDAIYSLLSIYVHKEKANEASLRFYFATELILAGIFMIESMIFASISLPALLALFIPYIIFYLILLKKKLFITRFVET